MKKFSVALLALATILAFTPAAKADSIACSADLSAITAGTTCFEGAFTFTFTSVSVRGGSDVVYFNGSSTGTATNANLSFQISGGVAGSDINLIYEVQGPAGWVTLDSEFNAVAGSGNAIAEEAYSDAAEKNMIGSLENTTGSAVSSSPFLSNGTFYINKDYDLITHSSEFSDSIEMAPEPGSLVLFGTGLIGLAGLVRRKYMVSR